MIQQKLKSFHLKVTQGPCDHVKNNDQEQSHQITFKLKPQQHSPATEWILMNCTSVKPNEIALGFNP